MRTQFLRICLVCAATPVVAMHLTACQHAPPPRAVEAELKLLESAALVIPRDCLASGSFVVEFTVATTGHTAAIRAPDAPSCIQEALTSWVGSFRYEAPMKATPATMEWMMVTAPRGS